MHSQDYTSLFQSTDVSSDLPALHNSTLFKVDNNLLQNFYSDRKNEVTLIIPYGKNRAFELTIEEKQVFADSYTLSEKNGIEITDIEQFNIGRYFFGKVKGNEESQVSLSIYNDRIAGIIRYNDKTYNIGKYYKSNYHIIYEVNDLEEDLSFNCETINVESNLDNDIGKSNITCTEALNLYFECDYDMYLNFNSNMTSVQNYIGDMFNEISTLYANENIPILISQIVVWTSNDPYTDNSSGLFDFKDELEITGYNGDLGLLLTNDPGNNGGIAYVNQLSSLFPFAYADIINSSNPYPTYSWDVQVTAHEIGHILGSRHTHECVWGPNGNQQIDDCGSVAVGYGGSCYNSSTPIIPSAGGTIMSYCHTQSVGINFIEGFGAEPGALIRQRYSDCKCDNATCDSATTLTSNGIYSAQPSSGNGASSTSATHADWFTFTPDSSGVLTVKSCDGGADTRLILHSGSCNNLIYESFSDDNCSNGIGNNYASEISEYNVYPGVTYFIEWDNRWSTAQFDWELIFVADTIPLLTLNCPSDYIGTNVCDGTSHLPSITGLAVSNDPTATIAYADSNNNPASCFETIIRTWTASSATRGSVSCTQLIEIEDIEIPTILNCPNDLIVASDTNCIYNYILANPQAIDNCDNSLNITSNVQHGDALQIGVTPIEYIYMDDCGNAAHCNFTVTVEDNCTILSPCDDLNIHITGVVIDTICHAKQELNTDALLIAGGATVFKAGQEIELQPGFEIQAGSTIEVLIEDCENN